MVKSSVKQQRPPLTAMLRWDFVLLFVLNISLSDQAFVLWSSSHRFLKVQVSVWFSRSSIDQLPPPLVQSWLLLSFTQPARGGSPRSRAAETRLHQFQMKHQHFLPLHQSSAPVPSPRSLTAPLSVCVMSSVTVCTCVIRNGSKWVSGGGRESWGDAERIGVGSRCVCLMSSQREKGGFQQTLFCL